jgi:tryptophanyl-tRNA synthetase
MGIVTDSTPVEESKDPEKCNLFALYTLFTTKKEQADLAERYRAGGLAYGHVKQEFYERMEAYFKEARENRARLEKDAGFVEKALKEGGQKARSVARETLDKARRACGLS